MLSTADVVSADIETVLDAVHAPDASDLLSSNLGPAVALRLSLEIANLRVERDAREQRIATLELLLQNAMERAANGDRLRQWDHTDVAQEAA